jgi:hypothetical protein
VRESAAGRRIDWAGDIAQQQMQAVQTARSKRLVAW